MKKSHVTIQCLGFPEGSTADLALMHIHQFCFYFSHPFSSTDWLTGSLIGSINIKLAYSLKSSLVESTYIFWHIAKKVH